jgi:glutaredoxin
MKKKILLSVPALVLYLMSIPAYPEVCQYTDNKGQVYFVDDFSQVPDEYRTRVKRTEALPEVNIVGRPGHATFDSSRTHDTQSVEETSQKTKRYDGKVEIFMTSWCGYCKQLARFLDAKRISYTTYDIEKDAGANRTYRELGGRGVPLSRIGSTIVRGYNPEAVLAALENER